MTTDEKKTWAEELLRQKYGELGRLPTKKDFDNMLYDADGDGEYETTALQLLIYAHEELYGGDWSEVTFDALGIVEAFVTKTECLVVTKAATQTTNP